MLFKCVLCVLCFLAGPSSVSPVRRACNRAAPCRSGRPRSAAAPGAAWGLRRQGMQIGSLTNQIKFQSALLVFVRTPPTPSRAGGAPSSECPGQSGRSSPSSEVSSLENCLLNLCCCLTFENMCISPEPFSFTSKIVDNLGPTPLVRSRGEEIAVYYLLCFNVTCFCFLPAERRSLQRADEGSVKIEDLI